MTGKYGITDKGTVAKGGSSASIKAYRAYLELAPSTARSLTLVIDNESGTTTAIGELVKTSRCTTSADSAWRRLRKASTSLAARRSS